MADHAFGIQVKGFDEKIRNDLDAFSVLAAQLRGVGPGDLNLSLQGGIVVVDVWRDDCETSAGALLKTIEELQTIGLHPVKETMKVRLTEAGVRQLTDLGIGTTLKAGDIGVVCDPQPPYVSKEYFSRAAVIDFGGDPSLGAGTWDLLWKNVEILEGTADEITLRATDTVDLCNCDLLAPLSSEGICDECGRPIA